jgi:hypothetical protein
LGCAVAITGGGFDTDAVAAGGLDLPMLDPRSSILGAGSGVVFVCGVAATDGGGFGADGWGALTEGRGPFRAFCTGGAGTWTTTGGFGWVVATTGGAGFDAVADNAGGLGTGTAAFFGSDLATT